MNPIVDFENVRVEAFSRTTVLLDTHKVEIRAPRHGRRRFPYLSIPAKFTIALVLATIWAAISIWLSLAWLHDLGQLIGQPLALYLVSFIAYVPGFMNAFLMVSLLLDRRPPRAKAERLPGVTVLVPCYNEAAAVADTVTSLAHQTYPGNVEFLVIDDGSKDRTLEIARETVAALPPEKAALFQVIGMEKNGGKSAAMNHGLAMARHKLVASVDGDCWLLADGLERIVTRYLADPPDTRAVAGTILVRNSRKNWITRVQEWDYFHGIAAIKRMQSMYHGTLVAQGAFSLYDRQVLEDLGGWPHCVGEDIVLSWAILNAGYRIGHCEDALMFTNVPETFRQFSHQRKRWSRGLIEAFMRYGKLLFRPRLSTLFVWWNLLFLPMDIAYVFGFMPGLILALFGYYYIAGIMTLVLLPMAMACNAVMLSIERSMFLRQGLKVRQNLRGFFFYAICYSFVLQPVSIWGYAAELLGLRKDWGTK
jgi:biofilm PGA synthesis N-glycosyltransferase PgaC